MSRTTRTITFLMCAIHGVSWESGPCPVCSGGYTTKEWKETCMEKIREAARKAGRDAQERTEKHIIEILKSENKENQDA